MNAIAVTVISILLGIIGYFLKRILDRAEKIGDDVSDIKPKVEILWKDKLAPANSPRQLNDRGINILEQSGIKEVVDKNKTKLKKAIQKAGPTNPYDAEELILNMMFKLQEHCPDEIDSLKNGAFRVGSDIGSVLFVGAIYLRNLIFPELGFDLEDLDKPKQ